MMRTTLVGVLVVGSISVAAAGPKLDKLAAVKSITATSTYADKNNAYDPKKVLAYETKGGNMNQPEVTMWSAWCEGKKDEGIGEAVTIALAEPTQIDSIKIAAGVWRTQGLFTGNNQITGLEITADGGKAIKVAPKAAREWTELAIGAKVSTLVVKITAVKKGKMNDSCISGIDLMSGENRITPIIGGDAKAIAALPKAIDDLIAALNTTDKKGLEPMLEFPFSNRDKTGFFEGAGNLTAATVKDFKALIAACAAYAKASEKNADGYTDPKGCPSADIDPDDERPASITMVKGGVSIHFPSHNEVGVTWLLHYKDRWRLAAIDYAGF